MFYLAEVLVFSRCFFVLFNYFLSHVRLSCLLRLMNIEYFECLSIRGVLCTSSEYKQSLQTSLDTYNWSNWMRVVQEDGRVSQVHLQYDWISLRALSTRLLW